MNRVYTKKVLLLVVSIGMLVSCSKEEEVVIEDELRPYIEDFIQEAGERGLDLDISDLTAQIEDIQGRSVVGQCSHNSNKPNEIVIDSKFWNSNSLLDREYVIFHELGHCLLLRSHLDEVDGNGNCLSIMQSGTINCNKNYKSSTRSKYLDELFDNK